MSTYSSCPSNIYWDSQSWTSWPFYRDGKRQKKSWAQDINKRLDHELPSLSPGIFPVSSYFQNSLCHSGPDHQGPASHCSSLCPSTSPSPVHYLPKPVGPFNRNPGSCHCFRGFCAHPFHCHHFGICPDCIIFRKIDSISFSLPPCRKKEYSYPPQSKHSDTRRYCFSCMSSHCSLTLYISSSSIRNHIPSHV